MKQMHVMNPRVELNTLGMKVNYYVASGKILVPDYVKEFVAHPARGPSQLSPIVEEETEG